MHEQIKKRTFLSYNIWNWNLNVEWEFENMSVWLYYVWITYITVSFVSELIVLIFFPFEQTQRIANTEPIHDDDKSTRTRRQVQTSGFEEEVASKDESFWWYRKAIHNAQILATQKDSSRKTRSKYGRQEMKRLSWATLCLLWYNTVI